MSKCIEEGCISFTYKMPSSFNQNNCFTKFSQKRHLTELNTKQDLIAASDTDIIWVRISKLIVSIMNGYQKT